MRDSFRFGASPFCVVDIETTGFSTQYNEITEIAAIRVDADFGVVEEFSSLVKISGAVPWQITRITGINGRMLHAHGRPLDAVLREVHAFLEGNVMFAHNAGFDSRFLDEGARRNSLGFGFPLECSIPVFKRMLPGRAKYGLPLLAEALGVPGGGEHRALGDCRVLLECLKRACSAVPFQ
jgi:DNA polymerase-3 subunit epsilon